jgi:hypothetical protein
VGELRSDRRASAPLPFQRLSGASARIDGVNNAARINAALAHAEGRPCPLCDGTAHRVGVWVPSAELDAAFEQPANPKEKLAFGYTLCSDCRAQGDAHKRVAAKLCATWGTPAND